MKRWVWAMFAIELCAQSARAYAQPEDTLSDVLKVRSQAAPCLTERALRERVRHWLAPHVAAQGVTVVVDAAADPPAFRVWRSGTVIAVRRFASLPSACADRLDAIALPVALAIEQATEGKGAQSTAAAPSATPAPSAPASAASAPAQSDSATPSATAEPTQAEGDAEAADAPESDTAAARAGRATVAAAAPNPSEVTAESSSSTADEDAEEKADVQAEADAAEASATDASGNSDPGAAISSWRIFAGAALLFEALPHTVVAVEAGPELLLGQHLSVSLGALVTAQTDHTLGTVQSQAQAFGGRALVCAGWPVAGFGLDACAGAIGGAVAVDTAGSDSGQTAAWVAGLVRAALRFPARGVVSVRLGAAGLLNAVRPRLLATGPMPRSATAGLLGAETSLELLIALP